MAKRPLTVTSVNQPDPGNAAAVLDFLGLDRPNQRAGGASRGSGAHGEGYSDEDFDDCLIDLKVTLGPTYGEPSEYVFEYGGVVRSGEDFERQVGKIHVYVVDLEGAYLGDCLPWDVLDSVDSGLAQFCQLISRRTQRFKPTVQRIAHTDLCRLLIIDRLEIDEPNRRKGLGLRTIDLVCNRMTSSSGCALAALKAYPIQWEGRDRDHSPQSRRDQDKLMEYYRRVGFRSVLGNGLMLRPLPD